MKCHLLSKAIPAQQGKQLMITCGLHLHCSVTWGAGAAVLTIPLSSFPPLSPLCGKCTEECESRSTQSWLQPVKYKMHCFICRFPWEEFWCSTSLVSICPARNYLKEELWMKLSQELVILISKLWVSALFSVISAYSLSALESFIFPQSCCWIYPGPKQLKDFIFSLHPPVKPEYGAPLPKYE